MISYAVRAKVPVHDILTIGVSIRVFLEYVLTTSDLKVRSDETVIVGKCRAGSPSAVQTVTLDLVLACTVVGYRRHGGTHVNCGLVYSGHFDLNFAAVTPGESRDGW